jgi:hypothetical protein
VSHVSQGLKKPHRLDYNTLKTSLVVYSILFESCAIRIFCDRICRNITGVENFPKSQNPKASKKIRAKQTQNPNKTELSIFPISKPPILDMKQTFRNLRYLIPTQVHVQTRVPFFPNDVPGILMCVFVLGWG